MNLKGKVVLITGGSSGLGLDAVQQFSQGGASVIVCGRSAARLQQVKARFPETHVIRCDVSDAGDVGLLVAEVTARGGIDILYNNAGVALNNETLGNGRGEITVNATQEMEINYLAVVRLTEQFLPWLELRAEPVIINTSSVLAYLPMSMLVTYSATKAALHSYTLGLRMELQSKGSRVKVYELMPPVVDTPFSTGLKTAKMAPAEVNRQLIGALGTDRFEVRPGQAGLFYHLQRLFPKKALKMLHTMGQ